MKFLFIHQNFPGQFRHTAQALARQGHQVLALRIKSSPDDRPFVWQGVRVLPYEVKRQASQGIHPWLGDFETKNLRAEACWAACRQLKAQGYEPDAVIAHPGWGEPLFVKNVWPDAKLGLYAEFFYQATGADAGFDPEFERGDAGWQANRLQMKNLNNLAHLPLADGLLSPTRWQASTFPEPWRSQITVVHDGVDTNELCPNPSVQFKVPSTDLTLSREDEVVTFVSRQLEPYRGFHQYMRALPRLLKARPHAHFLLVGDEKRGYGGLPQNGKSWREVFTKEIQGLIDANDWNRVHFLGRVSRDDLTQLLQVSTVHVYLTYPFVLSWSLIEAMSMGCAIVASDTAPVREVIDHGVHGRLVDFFNGEDLIHQVTALLDSPAERARLGASARRRAQQEYDLHSHCLQGQLQWMLDLAAKRVVIPPESVTLPAG